MRQLIQSIHIERELIKIRKPTPPAGGSLKVRPGAAVISFPYEPIQEYVSTRP